MDVVLIIFIVVVFFCLITFSFIFAHNVHMTEKNGKEIKKIIAERGHKIYGYIDIK